MRVSWRAVLPHWERGWETAACSPGSASARSFGAMLYSPRTGILLNNELLDLCWRRPPGSKVTPQPGEPEDPTGEKREGGQAGATRQSLGQPQFAQR